MSNTIDNFKGEYAWLSNFAEAKTSWDDKIYPTVEHAFQAVKTLDENQRETIRLSPTPGKAKRLGRKVVLRNNWEIIKEKVMLELVNRKFKDSTLRQLLIDTGDATLVEGNTFHDNFWGNCTCSKCQHKPGKNMLGHILMRVRDNRDEADQMGFRPPNRK